MNPRSRWSQNLFCNLVFMKVKVEKVFSSSTNPMIWTIINSITLMNLKRCAHNSALEVSFFHNLKTRLKSMGCSISPLSVWHQGDLEEGGLQVQNICIKNCWNPCLGRPKLFKLRVIFFQNIHVNREVRLTCVFEPILQINHTYIIRHILCKKPFLKLITNLCCNLGTLHLHIIHGMLANFSLGGTTNNHLTKITGKLDPI